MVEVAAGWWEPLAVVVPEHPVVVRAVSSAEILPLRVRVLRVGRPDLSAAYAADDGPTTLHLAAVDSTGTVIGTGTIYPELPPESVGDPGLPWLRLVGMAVAPEVQSGGVGGLILSTMLASADAAGLPIWATARDAALAFYERHGFATLPGGFVTAMGIPHHHIVWQPGR